MISRHAVLFAATALIFAGGCQSAPTPSTGQVAIAPRTPPDDRDGYLPQGPHFQTPDDIQKTANQYRKALAQNGTMGANDVPSTDTENDPGTESGTNAGSNSGTLADPNTAPPLVRKTTAPLVPGSTYAPRQPITPAVPDSSFTRSNSQSASSYSTPTRPIPPDPTQEARARTLASAAQSGNSIGLPDNIPPETDGARLATGRIAPDPATESLEDRLRRQAHDYPRDPLAQLDWELLCTLKEDPTGGFTGVAMLPDTDRELISALVDGVRNFRSILRANPDPMSTGKINPLLAMSDVIRSQAELDVPLVEICRSVEKFGNYETMDAMHFPSGIKSKFIVYCEIDNFVPQMDAKRMYQTRLVQQVEIFSDSGTEVWSDQSREVDDLCRRQRRDFFLYDIVTLPPNLSPGHYVVRVTVTDLNAKKFTQNATEIGIVGAAEKEKTPIPVSPSGPLWPFPQGTSAGGGTQYEPVLAR